MRGKKKSASRTFAAGRAARLGLLSAGAVTAALLVAPAGNAQDAELSPLTFTAQQVNVGRSVFGGSCSGCHGSDLMGVDGPPLIVEDWRWFAGPVADLFNYIQAAMPLDSPGSLNDRQVAGLVALIAEANGFTAGDVPLPDDPAELGDVGFQQPEAAM